MKKLSIFALVGIVTLLFTACGGDKAQDNSGEGKPKGDVNNDKPSNTNTGTDRWEKGGLKVYAMNDSPQYESAELTLDQPPRGASLEPGTNDFKFIVENFELGTQTADAGTRGLANSGKGQHIHFILNNGPYSAHYESEFQKELEDGHYVMLAFLSRSYHESVKSPNAYAVQQFIVGNPGNFKQAKLQNPHMFYSRPKGTYKGDDIKKLMLDFFLLNCDLSPDGYKVKANINGNDFVFTKWVPYAIEGLKPGEVTITLELVDKDGMTVKSPFNPVTRKVTLEAADPA